MGQHRRRKAKEEMAILEKKGFKTKIWAPLPEHKTSGHIHIVVLSTFDELCELAEIQPRTPRVAMIGGRPKITTRRIGDQKFNNIAESLRKARGFLYVDESH